MKIKKYCAGYTYEEFLKDEKTQDAIVRNFEIIGEASNRISLDFKTLHPEIEWRALTGFRNRLIHEYFKIDYQIVWDIIQNEIDQLILVLKTIRK